MQIVSRSHRFWWLLLGWASRAAVRARAGGITEATIDVLLLLALFWRHNQSAYKRRYSQWECSLLCQRRGTLIEQELTSAREWVDSCLRMRAPASQVGFDAAFEGFTGLAGDESVKRFVRRLGG